MKHTLRCTALLLSALVALSGLTACGSSGATSSAAPASPTSTAKASPRTTTSGGTSASHAGMIMIKDFSYRGPASVAPGAEVTVMNMDTEAHTVTADGAGGFDVKVDPGKSATFTAPTAAGDYKFHCTYHANMHGSLKVG